MSQEVGGPTNKVLTQERNRFWLWILALVLASIIEEVIWQTPLWVLVVAGVLIWRVWRLCHILSIPWWWTFIYSICSWLPVLFLVPLYGIILSFQRARERATRVERGLA